MAQQGTNNVINNYKGVMLCSRPNQKKQATTEKPFCGRQVPPEQLGLTPVPKQYQENIKPKRAPAVLSKHKQWLNQFKNNIAKAKEGIQEQAKREQEKFKRIREQGEVDRQRGKKMKDQYNQTATQVLNILDSPSPASGPQSNQLTSENLRLLDALNDKKEAAKVDMKKKEKPKWAMTKEEVEQNQDKQVDQLLDFFETNQVNEFAQDSDVKNLLVELKAKISKMKQQQDWKEKEAQRIRKAKAQRAQRQNDQQDDKYSHFSVGKSQGRSVASQKTQQKLQELRNMKGQQPDWDKHTTSQKTSVANLDDRIAKNIADQVLRNYPNLKGVHSNTSIRKLLQAQAAKVMSDPILRPVITTVVKEKQPINANNLPYLHRNPAI